MPEHLSIAAFVFGAVLILLALVGGEFKLFGAEISGRTGRFGRALAFVLGIASIAAGWLLPAPFMPDPPAPSAAAIRLDPGGPRASPSATIGGSWYETYPNPGNLSQITQDGDTFRYTVQGAVGGQALRSSGSGTIRGQSLLSTYQTDLPSSGQCSGLLSSDGTTITSTCVDSVYGTFNSAGVRQ
jgi:hypothetical protein